MFTEAQVDSQGDTSSDEEEDMPTSQPVRWPFNRPVIGLYHHNRSDRLLCPGDTHTL